MAKFPFKKEGDDLGAGHINALSAGVERAEAYQRKGHIPSVDIRTFDVIEVECDGDPNLYRIIPRYWDNVTQSWKSEDSDGNRGFSLDATDSGLSFELNDKVPAYYNPQRGTYIPLSSSSTSGSGSLSSCTCVCIEDGDIEVQDIITTSVWEVEMPLVRFEQTNGVITFPAGTYAVVYDSGTGEWTLDIGDVLTAAFNNGDDATDVSTLDGTLTMSWGGSVAEINLCVDGTIP